MAELGLLKENVKDFGLGWHLLRFDYVKFEVNGFAKYIYIYIYIVANIANDKEGLWFCCHLLVLIDKKIFNKKKSQ